jgi:hypothetical protein
VKEVIEILLLLGGYKGHVRKKWFIHKLSVFLKESHLQGHFCINTLSTSFISGYFCIPITLFKRETEVEDQSGNPEFFSRVVRSVSISEQL